MTSLDAPQTGFRYQETIVGGPEDSAERWGNEGLPVLSTPAIIGHMEAVCVRFLDDRLPTDQMTVGVSVDMRHLAPVRIGEPVEITVTAPSIGPRMTFTFDVTDGTGTVIASGTHRRAAVNRAEFLRRVGQAHGGS